MNPRGNRALDAEWSGGKRPRCDVSRQVIAELQKEQLHGRASILIEERIRRVVADAIDRTFSTLASQGRVTARKLHLQFKTNPAVKSFTESNLEDEQGDTICVTLIDANTGQPVTTGPGSVAKLEVVPLMGDFNTEEWTTEEFERHVQKEREGKGPLLVGDLKVNLNKGVGTLGQMYFTDNSSFTRSKKFRLGVRVDREHGIMSIREGKSQSFRVIENRGKAYMKHNTPSPKDKVWRLQNIGKNGPYHTRLEQQGIKTVEDFLSCLETRPEYLKEVVGNMSERAYQDTIDHARKCRLPDKIYFYPVEWRPYEGLFFDPNYQVLGAVADSKYVGLEMVHDSDKEHVDHLVQSAYDHWDTAVTECSIEPSMIAPPGAVDGSLADYMAEVPLAPQEAVDGSPGAEGVPNLESITGRAPPGAVDGSLADDMAEVPVAPQEAVDGSPGAEGVPNLESITGQDYADGNVIGGEWISQEQRSGYDSGSWSEELQFWSSDWEGQNIAIASQVQSVMSEQYGEPFELFALEEASRPELSRWWLRIRSVVRCAVFIRRARYARPL